MSMVYKPENNVKCAKWKNLNNLKWKSDSDVNKDVVYKSYPQRNRSKTKQKTDIKRV